MPHLCHVVLGRSPLGHILPTRATRCQTGGGFKLPVPAQPHDAGLGVVSDLFPTQALCHSSMFCVWCVLHAFAMQQQALGDFGLQD